jgi:hypothetical protein
MRNGSERETGMNIYITGKTVVGLLYPLLKAVQVYDINNDVVINCAKKFVDFIENRSCGTGIIFSSTSSA